MSKSSMKDLKVTIENDTGRNEIFVNRRTNKQLTRDQVVRKIENGKN